MQKFDPPGFLNDFNLAQAQAWSDWISQQIDDAAAGLPQKYDYDAPRPRFYNAVSSPSGAGVAEKDITWTAFPRQVSLDSATDLERWTAADGSRDLQDEYCEWSVSRANDGRITKVTFTCEGPEYWEFLAQSNPTAVVALYNTHVSPQAVADHIFDVNGIYNPRNRWNSTTTAGAMHLIQVNNTLSAEIELAAGASNVRAPNGTVLTDAQQLIKCGRYGAPERHSDPAIGAEVNALARADSDVTLANPVGIYFGGLSTVGWQTPDKSSASDYWKITRGTQEKGVRAVFEVPSDRGFVVGDITINGQPIKFGAQIADFITMKLTGQVRNVGISKHAPLQGCKRAKQKLTAASIDVESALGMKRRVR